MADEPGLSDVNRIYAENRRVEQMARPNQIITVALVTSLTTNTTLRGP